MRESNSSAGVPVANAPGSDKSFHPNGSSIDGLCFVKNFGPSGVM